MIKGYSNISLRDEDKARAIKVANSLAGPVTIDQGPAAIRLLIDICEGLSVEQAQHYQEQMKKEQK